MRHLILSREFPPASYPAGGIGTWVTTISRLLAEAGDTVHVVAEQWRGAPLAREVTLDGRLVIHRVPMRTGAIIGGHSTSDDIGAIRGRTVAPLGWAWNAAVAAESIIADESIDVIEGQEWEAPLAFLMLRRALGAGPEARPPIITHLHSPSERVWAMNDRPLAEPYLQHLASAEAYSITAADALVCPSRFLADEVAARYGIDHARIEVIPYPLPIVTRDTEGHDQPTLPGNVSGPVLHVGRLELRKGVMEFVDAAIAVSSEFPAVRFEFVGSDVRDPDGASVGEMLARRIPRHLSHLFTFTGAIPHSDVLAKMRAARFTVVPSRWDNLPHTCLESMAAGVPVLVSPRGGMRELVVDGHSGWVATEPDAAGLAAALRRALREGPGELGAMGRQARLAVEARCHPVLVTRMQREMRQRAMHAGAERSRRLPATRVADDRVRGGGEAGQSLVEEAVHLLLAGLPPVPAASQSWTPGADEWSGLTVREALGLSPARTLALLREVMHNPWRATTWVRDRLRLRSPFATHRPRS